MAATLTTEELRLAPDLIEDMRVRGKRPSDLNPRGQELLRRYQTHLESQGFGSYSDYRARQQAPAQAPVAAPTQPGFLQRAAEAIVGPGATPERLLEPLEAIPAVAGAGLAGRAILQGIRAGRVAKAAASVTRQVPLLELPPVAASLGRRVVRGAGEVLGDVVGTSRALITSFDLSGARQVLPTAVAYPREFARGFVQQFRSLAHPAAEKQLAERIAARPTFALLRQAGIRLPSLEGVTRVSQPEEMFARAHIAENLGLQIGRGVKASERAFNGIVTLVRADVFDRMLADTRRALGREINAAELGSLGKAVNTLTGRGDLGRLEQLGGELSTTLFAPRYMFSKLNLVNPWYYARLEPVVRKQVAKAALGYAGLIGATMQLAKASGLPVETNPISVDWGKLVIPAKKLTGPAKAVALAFTWMGLTNVQSYNNQLRFDLTHGFGTYLRAVAQIATAARESSGGTVRPTSPEEVTGRFLAGKAAPVPSLVLKILRRQEIGGGRVNVPGAVIDTFAPMFVQDVRDVSSPPPELSKSERRKRGLEFWPPKFR